jgi:hypothetical protein
MRQKNCTKTYIFYFFGYEKNAYRKVDPDPHQECGSAAGAAGKVHKKGSKLRFLKLLALETKGLFLKY